MKKVTLPAPPQPAYVTKPSQFADGATHHFRANSQRASTRASAQREAAARHDAGFIEHTFSRALWLGALMTMSAAAVSGSGGVGISVGIGVALSLALLKSQEVLVKRATRHLDDAKVRREYSHMTLTAKTVASTPLFAIGIGKYAVIGVLLALAFRQNWFSLAGFIFGFVLLHLVLMARAAGLLLSARVRPVGEVYAPKMRSVAPDTFSSTHGF